MVSVVSGMFEVIKPYIYKLKYRVLIYTMVWSIGVLLLHLSVFEYAWLGFETMMNALGLILVGAVLLSVILIFVPVLVMGEMILGIYIKTNIYKLKNRLIVYTIAGLSSSSFLVLLSTYEYIFRTNLYTVLLWYEMFIIRWFMIIFIPAFISGEILRFIVKMRTQK